MNVIVAVEFKHLALRRVFESSILFGREAPEFMDWDGSKKAVKGGHPFRRHIKKEDRARVAHALTSIETIAGVLGVAAAMFPGTTFTEPSEVGTSGIASCASPVLYEAPNAVDDDKQLNDARDHRAFFYVPRFGKPPATLHWLQRVTSGRQTRTDPVSQARTAVARA